MKNPKFTEDETIQLIHIRNHPDMQHKFSTNKGKHYLVWEEIAQSLNTFRKSKELSSKYNKMLKIYKKYYAMETKNSNINIKWPYYVHMKRYHANTDTTLIEKEKNMQVFSKNRIKQRKGCAYKKTEDFNANNNKDSDTVDNKEDSISKESDEKNQRSDRASGNDILGNNNCAILKLQIPELENKLQEMAKDVYETKNYVAKIYDIMKKFIEENN